MCDPNDPCPFKNGAVATVIGVGSRRALITWPLSTNQHLICIKTRSSFKALDQSERALQNGLGELVISVTKPPCDRSAIGLRLFFPLYSYKRSWPVRIRRTVTTNISATSYIIFKTLVVTERSIRTVHDRLYEYRGKNNRRPIADLSQGGFVTEVAISPKPFCNARSDWSRALKLDLVFMQIRCWLVERGHVIGARRLPTPITVAMAPFLKGQGSFGSHTERGILTQNWMIDRWDLEALMRRN